MDLTPTARVVVHVVHLWTWALYGGSLVYIYAKLFPDVRRWLSSDERFEAFSLTTAHGLRWWIFGVLIASGTTGIVLAATRPASAPAGSWWTIAAVKMGLLIVTMLVYGHVSYVMWPRRVFAAVADRPAEQRRFGRVAVCLAVLLFLQLLLGTLAHESGSVSPGSVPTRVVRPRT